MPKKYFHKFLHLFDIYSNYLIKYIKCVKNKINYLQKCVYFKKIFSM